MFTARVLSIVCLIFVAGEALAQQADKSGEVYLDVSSDAVGKLQQAEALIKKKDYSEAILIFRKLIESFPDKIVPLNAESAGSYISLPAYCHLAISKFPAAELANYRKDVDAQAKSLLQQYASTGDIGLLHRIVDELYCSSDGDVAIAKLGDFAFSDGNYSESAWLWGQLLPAELTTVGPNNAAKLAFELHYPDPDVDVARIAAKWSISQAMQGQFAAAQRGVDFLRGKFPKANGKIANKTGEYWSTIRDVIADKNIVGEPVEDSDWRTFAGNISRTKIVTKYFDIGGIRWNWPIELDSNRGANNENENDRSMLDARRENLCLFPVIVGRNVYVATDRRVLTFNLDTGKAEKWPDFQDDVGIVPDSYSVQPKHTLTVDGFRLYVRSGREGTEPPFRNWNRVREVYPSWIHCYDIRSQKKLWQRQAEQLAGPNSVIEGAPIGRDGKLYLSSTRQGAMDTASVICLDGETGELRWKTDICDAVNDSQPQRGSDQTLLTIGNDTVFLSTNLGVVGAVDIRTGRKRWVSTYPRTRRRMMAAYGSLAPDLAPCVFYQGKVFVAADDSSEVQCFDASTGARRWTSMTPVMHLLGISKGMLVATGQRVWGIDVESGKVTWYWPENTATPFGRGALIGDVVCWPTKSELHFLDQLTGIKARPSIPLLDRFRLTGGNVVVGADTFLLAQADRIIAFAPYQQLREKLQNELSVQPKSASLHFRLAQLAKDNGDYDLASEHFELAGKWVQPQELFEGNALQRIAGEKLFDSLLQQSAKLLAAKKFAEADRFLQKAESAAITETARFKAIERRIEVSKQGNNLESTVAIYQSIFSNAKWRDVLMEGPKKVQVPVRDWAIRGLEQTLIGANRRYYQRFEDLAKTELLKATTPEQVLNVAETFPLSTTVNSSLMQAAAAAEKAGQYRVAWLMYQRVAEATSAATEQRVQCYFALSALELRQGLKQKAKETLSNLTNRYGSEPAPETKGKKVADAVANQIVKLTRDLALLQAPAGRPQLQRTWSANAGKFFYYVPQGTAPSSELQTVLRSSEGSLALCRSANSDVLWEIRSNKPIEWAAHGSIGLFLASSDALSCLDYATGRQYWSIPLQTEQDPKTKPQTKTAKANVPASIRAARIRAPLVNQKFLVVDRMILASRAKQLTAINQETGKLVWQIPWFYAESSNWLQRINDFVLLGNRDQRIVLDPKSGTKLFEFRIRDGVQQLSSATIGDKLFAIVDRSTISAFQLPTGKPLWVRSHLDSTKDQPRLMVCGNDLHLLANGYEFSKLDPVTGKAQFSIAVRPTPCSLAADSVAFTKDMVVIADTDWLQCRRRSDAKIAWQAPLPPTSAPWALQCLGDSILTHSIVDANWIVLVWTSDGKLSQTMKFDRPGPGSSLDLSFGSAILSGTRRSWGLALSFDPVTGEKSSISSTSP